MNTPPSLTLTVTPRSDDYHCQLHDDPKVWDCGKTPAEAIGNWILSHGRTVGVTAAVTWRAKP